MSMYNMLFGNNPLSDIILATLDLTKADCGRFRDCFITEDKIAIYTRLGGGNREDYEETTKRLQSLPNYLYDKDDDFDCTYATFYYSFPEKYKDILQELNEGKFDPDSRWSKKLEEIGKMDKDTMEKKFPEIVQLLNKIVEKET